MRNARRPKPRKYTPPVAPPPSAPLGAGSIAALAGDGKVTLTQTSAPSGGDGAYTLTLYRSTTAGQLGAPLLGFVGSFPFIDTTAANGTTYTYTLRVASGAAAADTVQVSATPQVASGSAIKIIGHDFEDGTPGPFGVWSDKVADPVSIVDVPGQGKVARVRYERAPGQGDADVNGGLYYRPNVPVGHIARRSWGDKFYFRGKLRLAGYLAGHTPAKPTNDQRKLLYLKWGDENARTGSIILNSWGRTDKSGMDLSLNLESSAAGALVDYGLAPLPFDVVRLIELEMLLNTPLNMDGWIKVWVDGVRVDRPEFSQNILFVSPSPSAATDFLYEWGVGNQEQYAADETITMKSSRDWDDVEFWTERP